MERRSWTLIWKSFQIFLMSWMMVMGKSPQRSFFVSVLSTALPSSCSFCWYLMILYKVLQAVQFSTQVDFWQWKSQWDVSRQTSFWYFFQEHAYCNAVLWKCLKKTFHGRFSLQVLLGPHTPAGCGYESWYASLHLAEQTAQHAFRWSARLHLGRQAGCWSSTGQPIKRNTMITMKQRIRDTSIVEIDRNT